MNTYKLSLEEMKRIAHECTMRYIHAMTTQATPSKDVVADYLKHYNSFMSELEKQNNALS